MNKQQTLKDYKNIMVVGGTNSILVANYSLDYIRSEGKPNQIRRFKKEEFTYEQFGEKAIELNSLAVLNKYLVKIKQLLDKEPESSIICDIALNNILCDKILKGTYKYWISEGMTSSGKVIHEKEIEEWKHFLNNYLQVFSHVKFSGVNMYKTSNPKYNKDNKIGYGNQILLGLEKMIKIYSEETVLNEIMG